MSDLVLVVGDATVVDMFRIEHGDLRVRQVLRATDIYGHESPTRIAYRLHPGNVRLVSGDELAHIRQYAADHGIEDFDQ